MGKTAKKIILKLIMHYKKIDFRNFVQSFIEFSKPLIAIVNGPAIGISFTVLGLFDLVISSDLANFSAPFTKIALSPEGCSSYTFPKLMGRMKVNLNIKIL